MRILNLMVAMGLLIFVWLDGNSLNAIQHIDYAFVSLFCLVNAWGSYVSEQILRVGRCK